MPGADPVRRELRAVLDAGLARVAPEPAVARAVEWREGALQLAGRPVPADAGLVVLAVGKAAAAMAAELERRVGERICAGLAVTKDGHALPLQKIRIVEAGHPVPDARSEAAGRALLAEAARARASDVLVVLLSGGASALSTCPLAGLDLPGLAATTNLLLHSGADIVELNTVRKHLTGLSGGRLARASGAGRTEVLALSDVPGDAPEVIGSGPCSPDPSSYADALAIVRARGLEQELPRAVRDHLIAGAAGQREESVAPGDPALDRVGFTLLATNRDALAAMAAAAREGGLSALVVSERLSGEARRVGRRLAALGRALEPAHGPALLLFGGETTVTVRGTGQGGRNQELALAAAIELAGSRGVTLLAAGTDGSDGPTAAAGAWADGGSLARGAAAGASAEAALADNDSHAFFSREGGLLVTGPTHTNVMDVVLLRVDSVSR